MAVELGPAGVLLKGVLGRVLPRGESLEPLLSLSSERVRERRKAYERKDFKTYVGSVHLGSQNSSPYQEDWSFQGSAPVRPPNPEPNVADGDHVLETGDYLTIYGTEKTVLWEGTLRFYSDGMGFRHPLGVEEQYFLGLFIAGYQAELRTPALATAEETVEVNSTVSEGAQVRRLVFKA